MSAEFNGGRDRLNTKEEPVSSTIKNGSILLCNLSQTALDFVKYQRSLGAGLSKLSSLNVLKSSPCSGFSPRLSCIEAYWWAATVTRDPRDFPQKTKGNYIVGFKDFIYLFSEREGR